jgi:hypothetical protein
MMTRTVAVAILALTVAACSGKGVTAGPVLGGVGTDVVTIEVENGMPNAMRVLALVEGTETPIGRVDALSSRVLRVPMSLAGAIRLVARPAVSMDDRRHVSEPVMLERDRRLIWQLRASPGVSDVPRVSTFQIIGCSGGC